MPCVDVSNVEYPIIDETKFGISDSCIDTSTLLVTADYDMLHFKHIYSILDNWECI